MYLTDKLPYSSPVLPNNLTSTPKDVLSKIFLTSDGSFSVSSSDSDKSKRRLWPTPFSSTSLSGSCFNSLKSINSEKSAVIEPEMEPISLVYSVSFSSSAS